VLPTPLDVVIARRATFLTTYQNAAYAMRYRAADKRIRAAEHTAQPGSTVVSEAVARNLFKLMAIKDEYEVARLYTDGSFQAQLSTQFESYDKLEFHMAPPILGRRDSEGRLRKSRFGPWMMKGFSILAGLKGLRGTAFDVFGYFEERKMERALLARYEEDLAVIERELAPGCIEAAAALASVPAMIRGFGHVKQANAVKAEQERERLMKRFLEPTEPSLAAAE
jgi:indolepyruvate ferredoxin oxidoreductase